MRRNAAFDLGDFKVTATLAACVLCIVVFIGLSLGGPNMTWAESARWGYLPDSAVWDGRPWVLISSAFVHFEIWHIAFNVYWLWLLGSCLEEEIGPFRWLLFFVVAAWVSSAIQLATTGEIGIGMSGVVYALFGFGWVARPRMPKFQLLLTDYTINVFLIWLVGCIVATALNLVSIGNGAHLGGLIFGALAGLVFVQRRNLSLTVPALLIVVGASLVPLIWCPLSSDWTAQQAVKAQAHGNYATAITWYKRSLAQGEDAAWVWSNIASIEEARGNQAEHQKALVELSKVGKNETKKTE